MIRFALAVALSSALAAPLAAQDAESLAGKRVVFLGDSITQSGGYVTFTTYYLEKLHPKKDFDILGLGLASETLSGLSEDGHAGGKFPRPCLFERLGRLLEKAKPDVVFACYGMNDGIYQPLDKDRFAAFKKGVTKSDRAVQEGGREADVPGHAADLRLHAQEGRVQLRLGADRVREVGNGAEGARRDGHRPAHRHAKGPRRPDRTLLQGPGPPRRRRAPADGQDDPGRPRREGAGRDGRGRSRPTRCTSWCEQKRAMRSAAWMKHIGYTREKTVEARTARHRRGRRGEDPGEDRRDPPQAVTDPLVKSLQVGRPRGDRDRAGNYQPQGAEGCGGGPAELLLDGLRDRHDPGDCAEQADPEA